MKNFDITLYIHPEQMYCADCSRTISAVLQEFFSTKSLVTAIATDFRRKEVRFSIRLHNQEQAKLILNECKTALSKGGYDCTAYKIDSLDLAVVEIRPTPSDLRFTSKREILTSLPLLSLGIFLMLAEHFELLPPVSSTSGFVAQTSVGVTASLISGWVGGHYFKNAWRHCCDSSRGAMDSLIALGCLSAILYSFIKIFTFSTFGGKSNMTFFDVPLFTLGSIKLSHGIRDKVHANIEEEMDILGESKNNLPKCAKIYLTEDIKKITETADYKIDDKKLEQFFTNEIDKNSVIYVAPGDIVPIDGILIQKNSFQVRETFYGQKSLVIKKLDDIIYAGSANKSEMALLLKTICKAEDNHIRKAYASVNVNRLSSSMSLEKVSQYFFRGVVGAAITSSVGWLVLGPAPVSKYAAQVFLSVMLSACPCAFGLINISGSVAKATAFAAGMLVQRDRALSIDQCTDICFDKCGTLTTSEYLFKQTVSLDKDLSLAKKLEYLAYASILESQIDEKYQGSVAKAILQAASYNQVQSDFKNMTCTEFSDNVFNKGRGGYAIINDRQVIIGNMNLLKHHGVLIDQNWQELALQYMKVNELPIFMALDGKLSCLFILEPKQEEQQLLRPHTRETMQWLLTNHKNIHFITGDSKQRTMVLLAEQFADMDIHVQSDQTPQSKIDYVRSLQDSGKLVVVIGDDENDCGAIKQADFGLAIDTTARIKDEADAVLDGSIKGLIQLIRLAQIHRKGYQLSLCWAFVINSVAILAAAGVFYPINHKLLNPMITAGIMAFSSTFLMLNIAFFKFLGRSAIVEVDRLLTHIPKKATRDSLSRPLLSRAPDYPLSETSISVSINSSQLSLYG